MAEVCERTCKERLWLFWLCLAATGFCRWLAAVLAALTHSSFRNGQPFFHRLLVVLVFYLVGRASTAAVWRTHRTGCHSKKESKKTLKRPKNCTRMTRTTIRGQDKSAKRRERPREVGPSQEPSSQGGQAAVQDRPKKEKQREAEEKGERKPRGKEKKEEKVKWTRWRKRREKVKKGRTRNWCNWQQATAGQKRKGRLHGAVSKSQAKCRDAWPNALSSKV